MAESGGSTNQKLDLKIQGLFTNPNNLSEVPDGALEIADNIVIEKESIAESRRGQNFYSQQLNTSSGQINSLFNYRNNLLVHYNNKLAIDLNDNGTFTDFSSTYIEPSSGVKIRSIESNRNFYFTTNQGIYKLDGPTSTPRPAGAARGLEGYGFTTGSSGFMNNNCQVAYRVVWGYKDKNSNLILGVPSQRIIVSNSSGGLRDVDLTFTIPSEITDRWFYQVYRSAFSANSTAEPSDELGLIIENTPTPAEITAKVINLIDVTPEDLRGATLYTSPSQQGIANANFPPPYAQDMTVFKNHTFYANTKSKQRADFTIIAVESPVFGYVAETANTTNGNPAITNIGDTTDLRVGMRVVGSGIPTNATIVSIDSATQVTLSANASATATGVAIECQDRLTIHNVDYWGASASNPTTNSFLVFDSGTPAENIDETALELIDVINQSPSNTTVYAYYLSGFDDLPGKILIEERTLGGDFFAITSTYGQSFSPSLPERQVITSITQIDPDDPVEITSTGHNLVNGDLIEIYATNSTPPIKGEYEVTVLNPNTFTIPTDITIAGTSGYFNLSNVYIGSDNEEKQNRVFISKPFQPEAVPLYAYLDIGSADAPIRRIVALRDSVFVLKDDGIYRITGEDVSSFRVSLFDNTATVRAPESATAFNNQVFTFSDQGVIAISDSGVSVMSRPIENVLLQLSSSNYPNFDTTTFAVSYESQRQYILFTVTETDDTYATQAWVYNAFTSAWTRWDMDRSCGIINKRDNKLYMGNPVNDYIYQERKDFDEGDYADESYPVVVTGQSGRVISLTSASLVEVGMSIKQGFLVGLITDVSGNDITIAESDLDFAAGAAEVFTPILTKVKFTPSDVENPGILKQFREITLIFRDAAFNEVDVGFSTNFSQDETIQAVSPTADGLWGAFPWGTLPWGGGVGGQKTIRTLVPLEKQRGSWLNVSISGEQAFTSFSLAGISMMFNPMSERQR